MHNTHYIILYIVYDMSLSTLYSKLIGVVLFASLFAPSPLPLLLFTIHINYSIFPSSELIYIYIFMFYPYIVYHTRHTAI